MDGVTHDSFQSAAIARKLVKNDKIWIDCMVEANESETNIFRLRRLFVTILLQCEVGNHRAFYEHCKHFLHADFMHKYKGEFEHHPLLKKYVETKPSNNECKINCDDVSNIDNDNDSDNNGEWSLEK